MTTFVKKVALRLGFVVAVVVILAATLVSFSRMLTPYLNSHREDFEKWASEELHAPITIDQIHITWHYYQPILTFENVAILEVGSRKPNFQIQQIKVNLQVLPSLVHWQPMPNYIKLFGADVILREQTNGQLSVEGAHPLVVIDSFGGGVKANAAMTWILSQPRLVLDDINIKYIPLQGSEKSISLDRLSLVNDKTTHELSGNAILQQDVPTDIQFRIQVSGDVTDLDRSTVNAYFYLEGVSLPQWFKQNKWKNLQLKQGLGSAKVWVEWDLGKLKSIKSEMQVYGLEIKSLLSNKTLAVTRMNGKFDWKHNGDKEVISGEDILIDLPEHLWQTTGFSTALIKTSDGSYGMQSLQIDYLDLADTIDLVFASGLIPNNLAKTFKQMDLDGDLHSLNIHFNQPLTQVTTETNVFNNTISVSFSKLSFNAWQHIPTMNNLNGTFSWNGQQGTLNLDTQQASVELNTLFTRPLQFDQLKGAFILQTDAANGWILKANNIQMVNADVTAKANFTLALPENASPKIDLTADFSMANITPIEKYMPDKILEPELSHWLRNTFYGGSITKGHLILQGQMSDFPFDNNNGQFLVSADVKDLDFEYTPKWPGIKHTTGKLIFSGHKMLVNVDSGQMVNVNLKNVQAEIPYIGEDQPQILNIKSVIDTDLAEALEYVAQSPLQKTLGKDLAAMKLTGSTQLNLTLSIPLKTPEKTLVAGDLIIPDAILALPAWNLKLDKLSGSLHFTDKDINATGIKAILFGEPIVLTIDSLHTGKEQSTVVVKFQSKISKLVLQNWSSILKSDLWQGAANYSAQLNLTSDAQSKPSQLIITSDLKGIALNLPEIYGKKADETRALQFILNMNKQDQGVGVQIIYGNLLSLAATLHTEQGKTKFYSGELRLSDSGMADFQTKPGLLISGKFDKWDLGTWQRYLSTLDSNKAAQSSASGFNLALLRGIDISANQFSAYGLVLYAARIQAFQDPKNWTINVTSTEMAGQLLVPANFKGTIKARFQHLYLMPLSGATSTFDPKSLPAISFSGDDVRYNGMNFGAVSLDLIPTASGMLIQSLHANSVYYNLDAKGEWRSQHNNAKTTLQGSLESKDVGKLLNMWDVKASNLVESGGTAQFNLNWAGAPYSPILDTIVGDISLQLTAGRITDLSNSTDAKMGIGKMLNIFNLSNIPRRLSLNFKDFENGYSFDVMQGHFTLKNGSIFTEDTKFDGPIARIEISGRIGFVAKDYDVNFSVTPYGMTSSLPVVATFVGGPIAGAATWLVDRVVGGVVSNVITHHYTVRGPWSHPEWNEK